MTEPTIFLKRSLALALGAAMLLSQAPETAATDISSEPLAQPASSVKPNIMLILDDSGSMESQFTPDYIGRRFGGSNAQCYDSADGSVIDSTLENCEPGDPPLMSPDFNTQYYNPEIRYFPAVNYDGTSKISMTAGNTTNWTAVPTDGVSAATVNNYRRDTYNMVEGSSGTQVNTANLVTGYPERAWCVASTSDHTVAGNFPGTCRLNSSYTYPNLNFGFGRNSDASIKFVTGPAYYYRIQTTEHCTDATLTNCVAATTPTSVAGVSYSFPAKVRWCNSTALDNCQAKRQGSYTRPKFTGIVVGAGGSAAATFATATITVNNPQSDSSAGRITAITVNGAALISADVNAAGPISPNTAATAIRDAINANTAAGLSHGYVATVSSNVVTVRTANTGPTANGFAVNVVSPGTPVSQASVTFTISSASNNGAGEAVTSLVIGGVELLPSSITCTSGAGCSGNGTQRNGWVAGEIRTAINNNTSSGLAHGFTATGSGNTVTIRAPSTTGGEMNGRALVTAVSAATNGSAITIAFAAPSTALVLAGGVSSGDIETTWTNFSGGTDANEGRISQGLFVRTTIVPFLDAPTNSIAATYPKYPARTDCAGGACTYAEEMTNFANWYAYYRTRMHMAKTAIGRAFVGITDAFRVGFITINPSGDIANRFKAVADFTAAAGGTKDLWYQWLYKQASHGSTPLREALSRVGRYYGDKTDGINTGMAASPIQVACQPNYAILTTDGYWNGNAGVKLDGTGVGNQDNADSGYSLRADARYDGGLTGAGDSLADVALYYYKTDLRTDLADQVPTTTKDTAPHQHMTTFTVGMGLAGRLNFDSAYESGTSADFNRLKISPAAGGLDWPVPAADSETALDDLWHAAVNGRGTFFSAKDPSELANGITETLNSVAARVGAGAAAATSNLQPVAGDNFAFTAQYETVSWIGDLKAKTIDLSTGIVATRELWSAATLLDSRAHTTRAIYTLDAADTDASSTLASGTPVGISALTQDGSGLATATSAGHGLADGQLVSISGATPAGYNVAATITVVDANSFTFAVSSSLASPATGTVIATPSRAQNGNKLKSFCYPSAMMSGAYPTCTDGPGLSAAEMDHFLPLATSPAPSGEVRLTQVPTLIANGTDTQATKERLVDYLRGDTSYEQTGGVTGTDLFRNRRSVLGDIINAQPAYVKASPFGYNTGNSAGKDPFYTEYKSSTNGTTGTRKGTVFVAANDGMLHAFETDPDNNPYFQTAGITTAVTSDDTFTGTLNNDPVSGEGSERWSYIPSFVMPHMKRLADAPYTHRYYTDGSPVVGDVCFGHSIASLCSSQSSWHTILVAGVNAGGRGYYALDVTNPASPKALWEFKGGGTTACIAADSDVTESSFQTEDCNVGLSHGNPIIAKLPDDFKQADGSTTSAHAGKWVVIFSSGYNNVSPGDGIGHIYVVEAQTGKLLKRYSTGVGSTGTPSGIGHINAWVDDAFFNNKASSVYAGDTLGNLWRIQLHRIVDATSTVLIAANSVTRLATLVDPSNVGQPITTKPELGLVDGKRVVFVGTGRFLGTSDKTDIQRQSIYAIKDEMTSATSPVVDMTRSACVAPNAAGQCPAGFVKQVLAASATSPTTERTTATNPVNMSSATVKGWFIDLPDGGVAGPPVQASERVNVDPILQLGTLVIPTNVPNTDTCVAGGYGWINFLDYKTGGFVIGATGNMASTKVSASLVVGINVVQLPGGTVKTIVTTADNQQLTQTTPVAPSALAGRRVSWRELFFE